MRNRTADILITSEVLYQLSYGGSKPRFGNIVTFYPCVHDFLSLILMNVCASSLSKENEHITGIRRIEKDHNTHKGGAL